MRRLALLILVLVACGDAEPLVTTQPTIAATAAPITAAPSSTAPQASTTSGPVPATTPPPMYTTSGGFFPDPMPGSGDAHGSGCVTSEDPLPDGIWFGFAEAVAAGAISLDLACFWTGTAADAAAAADGAEAFDFYIRNLNPRVYLVPVAAAATAWRLTEPDLELEDIPASAWPDGGLYVDCPGEFCAVWVYINGGSATEIVEQYLP